MEYLDVYSKFIKDICLTNNDDGTFVFDISKLDNYLTIPKDVLKYKIKVRSGSNDPFIIIFDEQNKPIKAFYSECNSDAICQFDEYTNKKV